VAQITEAQRVQRIRGLLNELEKIPPEQHAVQEIPWTGNASKFCKVIKIRADEVLLNPESHRLRAQLQDDPRWEELGKEPLGEQAQKVLAEHVKKARSGEAFAALKESLLREGQTNPGVMTHKGVLINANTRAVAISELDDPARRYIRVAVLPETAQQSELALLELRLQMQNELKEEYSLTNELLFVEEMSIKHEMPPAQIARDLRLSVDKPKKGEEEVRLRLEVLDLLRQMQKIPAEGLKLTFFDEQDVKLEQLRGLLGRYRPIADADPPRARQILENWLLSVAVGVSNVHALRRVDEHFAADWMLPNLEEDEEIGTLAPALLTGSAENGGAKPTGVEELMGGGESAINDGERIGAKKLLDVVTQSDKRVVVPGTSVTLDRDELKGAVKAAMVTGVRDKRREEASADKLEAPLEHLKNASRSLEKSMEALRAVHGDQDFDEKRRKSLGVGFNKLRRIFRSLETTFEKYSIPSK
jgi:hypothetical protein